MTKWLKRWQMLNAPKTEEADYSDSDPRTAEIFQKHEINQQRNNDAKEMLERLADLEQAAWSVAESESTHKQRQELAEKVRSTAEFYTATIKKKLNK